MNDGSVIAGYRYTRTAPLLFDAFMISNVPEPATFTLVSAALLLLARRR